MEVIVLTYRRITEGKEALTSLTNRTRSRHVSHLIFSIGESALVYPLCYLNYAIEREETQIPYEPVNLTYRTYVLLRDGDGPAWPDRLRETGTEKASLGLPPPWASIRLVEHCFK